MNIGFFVRHFTERGTEVAIYDYAKYNEEILNNKSYIICFNENAQKSVNFPTVRHSYEKFKARFKIIEIGSIEDLRVIIPFFKLDYFYTLTHGGKDIYQFDNKNIWGSCKTIKHCVYDTTLPDANFNITISKHLNIKNNTSLHVIPHIIQLPTCSGDLRYELNIPNDAIVIGRHGGEDSFDIPFVHRAIEDCVRNNPKIYFLLMNTSRFDTHPQIIHVPMNIDVNYKSMFINTCDAMIHASRFGETFGISVGEFSILNKPVLTCNCGNLEHIRILGDKAILYNSKEELLEKFHNIKDLITANTEWNAYRDYNQNKVMRLFKDFIFDKK